MTHSSQPTVSIITPTYNREDLLSETIESVLSQNYANFEYIILDDGSTDNTQDILKDYDDPRLKLYRHDNMGVIKTVNKGFSLATGDYVTVVNSDDPLLPNYIEEMVAFLQQHPTIIGAYPDWIMIDEHSKPVREMTVKEYDYLDSLRYYLCYQGPGTMFYRRVFEEVAPYDGTFPTFFDYEFYMRVGMYYEFKRLPKVLATYRSHSATITSQKQGKRSREYLDLMDKLYQLDDMPAAARKIKRQVYASAHYLTAVAAMHDQRYFIRHLIQSYIHYPFNFRQDRASASNHTIRHYVKAILFKPIRKLKAILRPSHSRDSS